ncbi:MAG: DUF86 domain-containing protein [Nanoarchaeota archaeon]|nr:DUF86 domain-containing protein [Nanoarchaeota archaeon]MBU1632733.1 DUF86 domain-containing protein [Nanoarchaeota archaeon]MBU1875973.1 DUF86 domain-containing protein [Nanoarchaeota archaeon]
MKKIKLFDDIHHYLSDIEEILPEEEEFLKNKVHQYGVSMLMINIINSCIDIGSELISIKQLGYPETYRDVFIILGKAKIIPFSLVKKMQDLVGLRNLLAHEYGRINMELLYERAKEISFIESFLKKMVDYF